MKTIDKIPQLKGSALKVAQMLSMEKSILPQAYVEKFSLAQFSVPPLSPPLVIKTFKKYFGKHPNDIFDTFNATSVNAASIGLHADPHPGNFLVNEEGQLIALDFGCMKTIPMAFYTPYFELAKEENINNQDAFVKTLFKLEILREDDSEEELAFFTAMFHEMLSLFTQPFHKATFDFSDAEFFGKIAELGERYSKSADLKKMNGNRGSKHFIYINRTFFGLYNLMFDLKAQDIKINNYLNL